jgi:hypothetical protein
MLHELPVLVRKFFQAIPQRIAPRLEQASPLDRVFRQEIDRRIAQLRTNPPLLATKTVNLVMRDDAYPLHKISAQLKRFVLAPQHHANLLKDFLRVRRVAQERDKIGEQPTIVLREEPRKRVSPFMIRPVWMFATLHHTLRSCGRPK